MNDIYGLEVWFTGHVQGVGFRYQTLQVAKEFEVSGRVENLTDGRVHLIAEGREAEVIDFKKEVESQLDTYIKRVEEQSESAQRQYDGFQIGS